MLPTPSHGASLQRQPRGGGREAHRAHQRSGKSTRATRPGNEHTTTAICCSCHAHHYRTMVHHKSPRGKTANLKLDVSPHGALDFLSSTPASSLTETTSQAGCTKNGHSQSVCGGRAPWRQRAIGQVWKTRGPAETVTQRVHHGEESPVTGASSVSRALGVSRVEARRAAADEARPAALRLPLFVQLCPRVDKPSSHTQ